MSRAGDSHARSNNALGDILAYQYFLPNPLCNLVAPVSSFSSIPGNRLEKQVAALVPQSFSVTCRYALRGRHVSNQYLNRRLGHTESFQCCGIAQNGEISLVCVESVSLRMRGEYYGVLAVGVMQRARLRRLEHEVSKSVVDQVNLQLTTPQCAVCKDKFTRVCDNGIDVVPGEQSLKEKKLRIEVLLMRLRVYYRNGSQRRGWSCSGPFRLEHLNYLVLEHSARKNRLCQLRIVQAAGSMRYRHNGVKQCASGVRVDFNEAEVRAVRVEVVSEKYALYTAGPYLGDVWRIGQYELPVCGKPDD